MVSSGLCSLQAHHVSRLTKSKAAISPTTVSCSLGRGSRLEQPGIVNELVGLAAA